MRNFMAFLLMSVVLFVLSSCGGISPTPGVPEEKWEGIVERVGGNGQLDSDGVNYMRNQSQKILIDSFQVKFVYEKRKGEQSSMMSSSVNKNTITTTKILRWRDDVYKDLSSQLYDQFVALLEKRGHSVVSYRDYLNHADYSMIFEGQKNFEDTKIDSYLNACDARTDMCYEWVTATAHDMKLKGGFTGVSAGGDKFAKVINELGADVELSIEAQVTFGWDEGNVIVNDVKVRSQIGKVEAKEVWGKTRYFRDYAGFVNVDTRDIVGEKYADFPGLWDRVFKDKEVTADHKKFIEGTMGAFSEVFDAYSTIVAKQYK